MKRRGFLGWLRLLAGVTVILLGCILQLDGCTKLVLGYNGTGYVETTGTTISSELGK